jgi:protein-S-isoprenylcysteine O-methyltransferase Ste14
MLRRMPRPVIAWTLVLIQLVLIIGAVAAPGPTLYVLPSWARAALSVVAVAALAIAAISLLGLGRGLTASPVPREEGALVTDGLFGVVRHPTYSALGVAMGALAIASGGVGRLLCTAGLFVLFAGKARWEERLLTERFPVYPAYAARVPRFVPKVRRRA